MKRIRRDELMTLTLTATEREPILDHTFKRSFDVKFHSAVLDLVDSLIFDDD